MKYLILSLSLLLNSCSIYRGVVVDQEYATDMNCWNKVYLKKSIRIDAQSFYKYVWLKADCLDYAKGDKVKLKK